MDQFLAGYGGPGGDAVDEHRVLLLHEGNPAEPGHQVWLAVAPVLASKQVRSPCGVLIFALYLAAIFVTVDWYFAARVFSIDVLASIRVR